MAATSPEHPHTGISMGVSRAPANSPNFGDVVTCQCASVEDAWDTWPFLLFFSHISGKVPVVKSRELHMVRSRAEEVHL